MCIIAIKPQSIKLQNKEVLERCFTLNRDGAGYMFVDDTRQVVFKKGFMKFNEFYKQLIEDYNKYDLKSKNLVMHFRIGTSGENEEGCTHPFPVTDDYDEMEKTKGKTNIGVCHNGIVSMFNNRTAKYSDTQIYIETVITPLIRLNLNSYKFKDVQNMIQKTTNSKWTILDRNDDIFMIGDFIEDGGYYYSNGTYKIYKNTYSQSLLSTYSDSDWYSQLKKKQEKEKKDTKTIKKYKMLEKGNVLTAEGIEFMEIEVDNKYYFNEKYEIYEKTKDNKLSLIGTKADIYTNETFSQRRGFDE